MTAKKAATSAKHKTVTKKHKAAAKHTETKAQLAHLHVLHVEHEAHLAHMAATGQKVTVKAAPVKPAKATKKVAFAVGDHLPVCGIEAVAQSLRLAGQRVGDDEVAWLWELLGSPADGVPVGEALAAAALFGLAGCHPVSVERVGYPLERPRGLVPGGGHAFPSLAELEARSEDSRVGVIASGDQMRGHALEVISGHVGHGLILGVDRPGPHAVLATADGWWSWGELFSPWPCHVSEAWAVSWS